ncbi:GTP-binding protein HflX [Cutibacterium acnes JCM 18920]|nr:GTP-binding protein HflX [Cutibacterium acnes JCM 18920]
MSEIEQIDNEREDALKSNNGFSDDQSDYDGDQFDLDARLSLTRVPGMSTDLSDISEVEYRQLSWNEWCCVRCGLRELPQTPRTLWRS